MKAKRWMFAAVVAGGALIATRACTSERVSDGNDPDEKLARQFDDLCKIAKGGIENPVKGVRQLGHYLVLHTGDMMKNLGDTFAMIERIRDDDKHDERARQARETMVVPLDRCGPTWDQFGDAIEANEEAVKMVEHATDRLERSMNIIFSGAPRFTFRGLPSQLEQALGASLRGR